MTEMLSKILLVLDDAGEILSRVFSAVKSSKIREAFELIKQHLKQFGVEWEAEKKKLEDQARAHLEELEDRLDFLRSLPHDDRNPNDRITAAIANTQAQKGELLIQCSPMKLANLKTM